jgi:hypothetical protein
MVRRVLRLLGVLLLLAGVVLLARDLFVFARGGVFQPETLDGMWSALSPGSLDLLQGAIQRHVSVALWDRGVLWLLQLPAFVLAIVLGALLILLNRRRRRTLGFR